MTDTLKTVLLDALNAASEDHNLEARLIRKGIPFSGHEIEFRDVYDPTQYPATFDADRLVTAVRDHFLDREKVLAAIKSAIAGAATDELKDTMRGNIDPETIVFDDDVLVDRLIAGLAGGSE